jgi:hypothetical protein
MNFSFFSTALTFFVSFLCQDKKENGGQAITDVALKRNTSL